VQVMRCESPYMSCLIMGVRVLEASEECVTSLPKDSRALTRGVEDKRTMLHLTSHIEPLLWGYKIRYWVSGNRNLT
jgi:hypothetical protein